jgi:hypothetical protein
LECGDGGVLEDIVATRHETDVAVLDRAELDVVHDFVPVFPNGLAEARVLLPCC